MQNIDKRTWVLNMGKENNKDKKKNEDKEDKQSIEIGKYRVRIPILPERRNMSITRLPDQRINSKLKLGLEKSNSIKIAKALSEKLRDKAREGNWNEVLERANIFVDRAIDSDSKRVIFVLDSIKDNASSRGEFEIAEKLLELIVERGTTEDEEFLNKKRKEKEEFVKRIKALSDITRKKINCTLTREMKIIDNLIDSESEKILKDIKKAQPADKHYMIDIVKKAHKEVTKLSKGKLRFSEYLEQSELGNYNARFLVMKCLNSKILKLKNK